MRLGSNDRPARGVRPSGARPRPARRSLAGVLALLLTAATTLLLPGTAEAHTVLKYSNPSAGQVLRAAPENLELAFNEKLRAGTAQVAVTVGEAAPVQVDIEVGEDVITSDLTAEPLAEVPEGEAVRWKIGYRIVSEDGHPVSGVVEFTVDRTLLSSTPAEGAVLSALPAELELTFGGAVAAADPAAVSAGDLAEQQVPAVAAGNTVRLSLAGLTPSEAAGPQSYRVGYRVTGDDGQVLTGLLLFTVDPAAGTAPATLEPLPSVSTSAPVSVAAPSPSPTVQSSETTTVVSPASSDPTPSDAESGGGAAVWIIVLIVLLLAVGAVTLIVVRRVRSRTSA